MSLEKFAKDNSSLILAISASGGVLTTAYLSAKAGYKTAQRLEWLESEDPYADFRTKAWRVWRLYIPSGVSALVTVGCIVGVKRIDGGRALAAQAAFSATRSAYDLYRERVAEEFGEKKEQLVRAAVAERSVAENPPPISIVVGEGDVLCCELFTGRYFPSSMEKLNKAVNEVNAKLNRHDYAYLDDFYHAIGQPYTTASGHTGWESTRLLELEFSSVISPDGKPCLAFDYNYVKPI